MDLHQYIVDRSNIGVLALDSDMNVTLWNKFMEHHSGVKADQIIGKCIFDFFPNISKAWLKSKVESVFLLKNFAFTNWEQRPFVFEFKHNRSVTGAVIDHMRQNCSLFPVKNAAGEVEQVVMTVIDVTDSSIYQCMLEEAKNKLEELSIKDALTGIYNRRYLQQRLESEFNRACRYSEPLTLIIFDLDKFKNINDTFGHQAGDIVLQDVAARLDTVLRNTDICGRYGGEEFLVILPNSGISGAAALAERIRVCIEAMPVKHHDVVIDVTISLGVAQFTKDITNYEQLVHCADVALYASKQSGRNAVTVYDDSLKM